MKIEKIENKYNDIFGDAEIHLQTTGKNSGQFFIKLKEELPEEYQYDEMPTSTSLEEIRKMIVGFSENCIRQKFIKKKLFICVGSSSKTDAYNKPESYNVMFDQDNWKMFNDGDGLYIAFAIMNVYSYKYKTIIGKSKGYFENRMIKYDDIYGWKEKELYEIIDGNSEKFKTSAGKLLSRTKALDNLKYTHEMDYDENVHKYLQTVCSSLNDMVERVMTFFNVSPELLTQNILAYDNNIKLLS